jgi:hypothetical protein
VNITIGADPEVFVKQNGVFVSAHNLVPGTKEHPFPVDNGAVQVDGMALEYNILPCSTKEEFIYRNKSVLSQLKLMVPEHEVVVEPVAHFTKEYMKSQPKAAIELGCDPDYSAWFMQANMRTAAGHVHIGWKDPSSNTEGHENTCAVMAREMDYFLGIYTLLYDKDSTRRSMYGGPGCYRSKSYGVEYRTPSNKWLETEQLMGLVFDRSKACATSVLNKGSLLTDKYDDLASFIIERNEFDWQEKYPELHNDVLELVA